LGYYESVPLSTQSEIIYTLDLAEKINFKNTDLLKGFKTRDLHYFITTLDTFKRFHGYKIPYNNQLITTYFSNRLNSQYLYNRTYFNYFRTTTYQGRNVSKHRNGWAIKEEWINRNLDYEEAIRTRSVELIYNSEFVYSVRVTPGANDH